MTDPRNSRPSGRGFLRHVAMLALLSLPHVAAQALTPLTPSLTAETREQLLGELAKTGFPEVGRNSVVITLADALGIEPRSNSVSYDQSQPHLPKVTARAERQSAQCVRLTAAAWYEPPASPLRVAIDGAYCLTGPGRWNSTDQTIRRAEN